jgi:hypothetical protein
MFRIYGRQWIKVAVARILKIENFNFDETIFLVMAIMMKNVDCRWTWFSNG